MFSATPEVTENPSGEVCVVAPAVLNVPFIPLVCVVMRAQAHKLGDSADFSDSYFECV